MKNREIAHVFIHMSTIFHPIFTIVHPMFHHMFTICLPYFHQISPYFHHIFTMISPFKPTRRPPRYVHSEGTAASATGSINSKRWKRLMVTTPLASAARPLALGGFNGILIELWWLNGDWMGLYIGFTWSFNGMATFWKWWLTGFFSGWLNGDLMRSNGVLIAMNGDLMGSNYWKWWFNGDLMVIELWSNGYWMGLYAGLNGGS